MDKIAHLGTPIFEILLPTFQVFGDILRLATNASAIRSTHRETHSYGPHERHDLDLYSPSPSAPNPAGANAPRPVFVFVYGGGFVTGSKILPAIEGELAYANVGYFLAEKLGYETVIMDYRLLEHGAKFPSGGKELDMVMEWVEKKFAGQGQRDVFVMGNSAGGVHVCTWLFRHEFHETVRRMTAGEGGVTLKGAQALGCPFSWMTAMEGEIRSSLLGYYGDEKSVGDHSPVALMKKAKESAPAGAEWPPILVIVSEFDPEDLIQSSQDFIKAWKEVGGTGDFWVLEGQNHISPALCFGTGMEREEKWGYDLGKWMSGKK